MGLDMYLYRKQYVKNWDYMEPEERHTVTLQRGEGETLTVTDAAYVVEEVAYWRKANAIHAWFVNNCQGGVDDCRDAYVSIEHLEELREKVDIVLNAVEYETRRIKTGTTYNRNDEGDLVPEDIFEDMKVLTPAARAVAEEHLPTQAGFFFGGTEYTEWYIQDLEYTKEVLDRLIKKDEDHVTGRWYEYEYSSSW